MHKINGDKVYLILKSIMDLFKEHTDITIHWGSSDGFQSHKTFLRDILKEYPDYLHFFDVVHILKNLRNHILNKAMELDGIKFSMKTLRELRDSDDNDVRRRFRKLVPHDPVPTDKMEMKMVSMLLKPDLIAALCEGAPAAKKLGEYFQEMRDLEDGMMNNDLTWEERLGKLAAAEEYFRKLKGSLGDMHHQIATTATSAKKIHEMAPTLVAYSVFGTLIVENFFSTIRAKIRYPSLWEYSIVYSRAWMELIKNNADDNTYIGPKWKESFGKCYGNQTGTAFSMKSIKLLRPSDREGKLKAIADVNKGTEEQRQQCEKLVEVYKCSRRRFTTREVTCKESPIAINKKLE